MHADDCVNGNRPILGDVPIMTPLFMRSSVLYLYCLYRFKKSGILY